MFRWLKLVVNDGKREMFGTTKHYDHYAFMFVCVCQKRVDGNGPNGYIIFIITIMEPTKKLLREFYCFLVCVGVGVCSRETIWIYSILEASYYARK